MSHEGFQKYSHYSLVFLYGSLALGCLLSTHIIHKMGTKNSLVMASILDSITILLALFPALKLSNPQSDKFYVQDYFIYLTTALSAIIMGFAGAIQWVAQGYYISSCATNRTKGLYFSIFWAFYMASQIIGSVVSAYVLKIYSQPSFYCLMGFGALLASLCFAFLQQPIKYEMPQRRYRTDISYSSIERDQIIMQDKGFLGWREAYNSAISIIKLATSRRMLIFLPQIFWTGISLAVYSGILVSMITYVMVFNDV